MEDVSQAPSVPSEKPGQPIGGFVNQSLVNSIMDMGFTREVSEKSLLFTGNG